MVLSHPRPRNTAFASSPASAYQAAELCRRGRVRAPDAPLPTHATVTDRLYGLPDYQNIRAGVGDAPLAGHHAILCDGNRGRGDTDGNQGPQGTRAQPVRLTIRRLKAAVRRHYSTLTDVVTGERLFRPLHGLRVRR